MIRIYGASDDLVEIEGDVRREIDCYERPVFLRVGSPDTGGCVVGLEYAPRDSDPAVWRVSVQPLDEGMGPRWPIRIEPAPAAFAAGYSLAVVIECPPGTPVVEESKP